MKNKNLNVLFVLIICYTFFLGSLYIEAEGIITNSTFAGITGSLTTFYNKLEDANIHFQNGPFTCSGTDNVNCSGEQNIGIISKIEYETISKNGGSYLKPKDADPNSIYWINETEASNAYVSTFNGLDTLEQTGDAGVRASLYIKSDTALSGSGTYNEPYTFTNNREELDGAGDVNILAFYVDKDRDGSFDDEENNGLVEAIQMTNSYQFIQATCEDKNKNPLDPHIVEDKVSYKDSNKSITITGINEYIACKIYLKDVTGTVAGIDNIFDRMAMGKTGSSTGSNPVHWNSTTYVIDYQNNLWGWGYNNYENILNNSKSFVYVALMIMPGKTFKSIAAGDFNALAIDTDGKLWTWGINDKDTFLSNPTSGISTDAYNALPGKKIIKACGGNSHSAALDENGNIWTWGKNDEGQLGNGKGPSYSTPITSPYQIIISNSTHKFIDVDCSEDYTLAIDSNYNLWGWGSNSYGQLGLGHHDTPVKTPSQSWNGRKFVDVDIGYNYTLAIEKEKNQLYAWGNNICSQLGNGNNTSKPISYIIVNEGTKFKSVRAGFYNSSAIDMDGNLYIWGNNENGQLVTGNTDTQRTPYIQPKNIVAMIANGKNSLAIDNNYRIFSAGYGVNLGIGYNTAEYHEFKRVDIPDMKGER